MDVELSHGCWGDYNVAETILVQMCNQNYENFYVMSQNIGEQHVITKTSKKDVQ